MRVAYKVWSGAAAGVFCLVAVSGLGSGPSSATAPSASSAVLAPSPVSAAAAPAPVVGPPRAAVPAGTRVSVVEVIDGDTFRTADGTTVRVLGIDSCEAATPGGERATGAARAMLSGSTVTLVAEPGADRDRYGRALRHVEADGRDVAEEMVVADHTAVYAGRNDASVERQATLRTLDRDGRVCGTAPPPATSTPAPSGAPDEDRPATRRPVAPDPAPVRAPSSSSSSSGGGGSAHYKNCSAAKAAGAAPLYAGRPGYSGKLDRDGDGVACER